MPFRRHLNSEIHQAHATEAIPVLICLMWSLENQYRFSFTTLEKAASSRNGYCIMAKTVETEPLYDL